MNTPNRKYPKTPPFVFDNDSNHATNEPASQPVYPAKPPPRNEGLPSERGMLSVAIFLISSLSMGIGLAAGAWVSYRILEYGLSKIPFDEMLAGIAAVGLAYGVGWVVGLFGMRMLGNFILPYAMTAYSWLTLAGLSVLQIVIIAKLYKQGYDTPKFIFYLLLFGAGIVALIGIHLLIEDHNLVPFSFPILIISLSHLFLIVYHYVFVDPETVEHGKLGYDAIFFFFTSTISVLMLAHLGVLEGFRKTIGEAFSQNTNRLVPPS